MKDGERIDFLEMTTDDFKRLNLYILKGASEVKNIISKKKTLVYHTDLRSRAKCLVVDEEMNTTCYTFICRIDADSLLDFTEKDFRDILRFTADTTSKYLWLQKYIKREVDGAYFKDENEYLINEKVKTIKERHEKEIVKLKEKINYLCAELDGANTENKILKAKLKRYEKFKNLQEEISKIRL